MSRNFRIYLKNLDPLRIADDKTSQHGQTGTLRRIPGSALRGYVMSALAQDEEHFASWKKAFFNGQIRFLNAYLAVDGQELIPSLKGFYEDKTACVNRKRIQNVLEDAVESEYKGASLGSYCFVEEDTISYTGVELSEHININNGRTVENENQKDDNRNIYRSQYLCKGQDFIGYVETADDADPELVAKVTGLLNGSVHIGNRRSGGYGTCETTCREMTDSVPYQAVRTQKSGKEFYMVLLSNLVMRSEIGELTGLNLEELAERLGCQKLELKRCATSTAQVYGYNRIWKGTIPSANMYEAGSVFRLAADQEIPEENFRKVEAEGLGIRTAEGFGQVAFMADFQKLQFKHPMEKGEMQPEIVIANAERKKRVQEDCKLAARGLLQHRIERGMDQYVVEHAGELRGITASQLGRLASTSIVLQYTPEKAKEYLNQFVEHSEKKDQEKKKQDNKMKQDSFHRYVKHMTNTDILKLLEISEKTLLGVPVEQLISDNERTRYKLQLMERQIRYANREGK